MKSLTSHRRQLALVLSSIATLFTLISFSIDSQFITLFACNLVLPGLAWFHGFDQFFAANNLIAFSIFAAFGMSLFLWITTGNFIAPVAVYLLNILATFWISNTNPTLNYIPILLVALYWLVELFPRKATATIQLKRNWDIKDTKEELPKPRVQFLTNRALQPIDTFNGFEQFDQFQTAAVRYQISFLGLALSMASFKNDQSKSLAQAQRNLIEKQTLHSTWRYWQLENFWGNASLNPDPICRDNIMFSGFLATQIEAFHSTTGSNEFDQRGSLRFIGGQNKNYFYDQPKIIECLSNQYQQAKFGLLPCEPNWIYPICNLITACAMKSFDNRNSTRHWYKIESAFYDALTYNFMRDNQLIPFASSYTGLVAPQLGGVVNDAFACLYLNVLFPELATQVWAPIHDKLSQANWKKHLWPIDIGNYRLTRASSYVATAVAAKEMGDHGIYERLMHAYAHSFPEIQNQNTLHRPNVSVWAHAVEIMSRANETNGFRNMMLGASNSRAASL